MDVATIYRETRGHLLELARTMDDEQPALPVPALPGWTVKDAYAHLTGLCADVLDGNMAGAGDPAWTRRQVAERSVSDLAEICAEWGERGPELEVWIEGREDPPMFVAYDVWSHEQDVMGALGLRGERGARARGGLGSLHRRGCPAAACRRGRGRVRARRG